LQSGASLKCSGTIFTKKFDLGKVRLVKQLVNYLSVIALLLRQQQIQLVNEILS